MPGHSQASGPYPAPEGSPVAPSPIDYTYTHAETLATTGYFSCEPPSSLSLEAALERLEATPLDDFLHQHLLRVLSKKSPGELRSLAATCYDAAADVFIRPALAGLLLECALLLPACREVCNGFPADAAARLAPASPTVYLRAALQSDREAAAPWGARCPAYTRRRPPPPRPDHPLPDEPCPRSGKHPADGRVSSRPPVLHSACHPPAAERTQTARCSPSVSGAGHFPPSVLRTSPPSHGHGQADRISGAIPHYLSAHMIPYYPTSAAPGPPVAGISPTKAWDVPACTLQIYTPHFYVI